MKKRSPCFEMPHKYMRIGITCGILFFVVGLFFIFPRRNSNSSLDEISQEDRLIIKPLLKDLVFKNHFGYVLLGEKPVSIASYFSQEPFANLLFIRKAHAFNCEHSWKILEKYAPKLNSGNFVFLKKKSNLYISKNQSQNTVDVYEIAIINKKLFLQTVKNHLDLFRKTLGDWVTPISLLAQISEAKVSLFEALGYDEGLLGILLGYGKTNALAFKRNMELACVIDPYFREIVQPFTLHFIKPSPHFCSLEEEYAYFQEQLSFFDLRFPLSPFTPPAFRVLRGSEETLRLKYKYRIAHRRLVKMYYGKDFLEITLKQFLNRD
jgi:hypothetical protein